MDLVPSRIHVFLALVIASSSSRTALQDLLDVLSTVLECGLLVMQSLLELGDVLLQRGRLSGESLVECIDRNSDEHLANAFVDWVVFRKGIELARGQLVQSGFSSLPANLCLGLCDFLL